MSLNIIILCQLTGGFYFYACCANLKFHPERDLIKMQNLVDSEIGAPQANV